MPEAIEMEGFSDSAGGPEGVIASGEEGLEELLTRVRACAQCVAPPPFSPNPVLRAGPRARLMIIGQAPGTHVHRTGIPWNDLSGDRLRAWMGLTRDSFYDVNQIAIVPMGFCYPGKGKSGDLPPRPECAPLWHDKIRAHLPKIRLTLLIGQYAHAHYLKERRKATLTETVKAWREYLELGYLPIVHPSPRNRFWLKRNPWFERDVVPALRKEVGQILEMRTISRD